MTLVNLIKWHSLKNQLSEPKKIKRDHCFIDVLKSIQATSVNCERLFSTTGWYNSRVKNRLSAECLEATVFLKSHPNKIV